MKEYGDITFSRWGPILGLWSFFLCIFGVFLTNPLYYSYFEPTPLRLAFFILLLLPTIIVLYYRFKNLKKLKKKIYENK